MARPRKLTRDPDKKPRSFDELQRIHGMAGKLYELTGGGSLDLQIAALDRTQAAYAAQMDAAEMMKSDVGAGAWGPTVTPHESRLTASTSARLHKLREQKMAQCLLWAEEGAEASAAKAAAAETAADDAAPDARPSTVPGEPDRPRPSEQDRKTAPASAPAKATSTSAAVPIVGHPGSKNGDSPSTQTTRGGQPPLVRA
jgi:hypothetical protein